MLILAALLTDAGSSAQMVAAVLYLWSVVLGVWVGWRPYPVVAAAVAAGLVIVVGAARLEGDGPQPKPAIERAFLVLSLAGTAVALRSYKDLERRSTADTRELADIKRALDHAAIVATTDVQGRITYVNEKFCEISEYSRDELLGRDHRIINSSYHSREFIQDLWRTIAGGSVWHGELRNKAKSGRFYWVDTTIVPFLDATGRPVQYIAIRADITARKAAEEQLVQQATLAQVGQMAAVVAHEVRNPLAGIKGTFQVLMGRRDASATEVPIMKEAVARIDSLSTLIDDLMTYARPRPPRLASTDLRTLIDEAVGFLRRDPAWNPVEVDVSGAHTPIQVDADMIRAALLNLLINAAQAMNGRGRIHVALSAEGPGAVITVSDTGPGIPEDVRARMFEPFFTTKSRGGGLGLPVAKRTAELHGGSLTVTCPPAGGTLVTLVLPLPTRVATGAASLSRDSILGPVRPLDQAQRRPESAIK
jgi:PAS domain S-box-containing protein